MGLTRDNFQLEGKDASLTLFIRTGNRLWITGSPIRERSLGDTWSGPVALLGLAAFISLFFYQIPGHVDVVSGRLTLVIKVFKDERSKGSSCLVRSSLTFTKKSLKYSAFCKS